MLGIC